MQDTRPLAQSFPSAILCRHIMFFLKRNLLIDLKGSSASRRDNTGGGWGRDGRLGGWEEGAGSQDREGQGTDETWACCMSRSWHHKASLGLGDGDLPVAGVTVRTQESGLVFAGREVRFGQVGEE